MIHLSDKVRAYEISVEIGFYCAGLTLGLLCQTVHPAQVDPTELGPGQHVHRTRHLNIPSPARLPACPYLGVYADVLAGLQPEQTACGAGLDDALACQQRDGAQANSTRLDLLEIVQSLNGPDLTAHSNIISFQELSISCCLVPVLPG